MVGGHDDEHRTPDDDARWQRLLALLGSDPGDPQARLGRLCELAVTELEVSGAGVTVMGGVKEGLAGHRGQLYATDDLARRLEDLQLTMGEGPCLEAYAVGAPVLAGDLSADEDRWLGFAPEARATGASAVFSFPLQVGVVRLGTLDLHRRTAGALTRDQLADALILAGLATETLLELVGETYPVPATPVPSGAGDTQYTQTAGWLPGMHAEVHQASGMVSSRQAIGVAEALLRLRGYAIGHGVPIDQVARRVLDRDLVLDDPTDADPTDADPTDADPTDADPTDAPDTGPGARSASPVTNTDPERDP